MYKIRLSTAILITAMLFSGCAGSADPSNATIETQAITENAATETQAESESPAANEDMTQADSTETTPELSSKEHITAASSEASSTPAVEDTSVETQKNEQETLASSAGESSDEDFLTVDDLYGKMVAVNAKGLRIDMDNDGEPDQISLEVSDGTGYEYGYTLTINDSSITEVGYNPRIDSSLHAFSLNGETVQLIANTDSGDAVLKAYSYDHGEIVPAGIIVCEYENISINGNIMTCSREYCRVFQNVPVVTKYTADRTSLIPVGSGFYEMGNTVTARMDIKTYSEKGAAEEDGPVIPEGAEVIVVGTDNSRWVQLQVVSSGESCWLKAADQSDGEGYAFNGYIEMAGENYYAKKLFQGVIITG